jgi:hypothetical protein
MTRRAATLVTTAVVLAGCASTPSGAPTSFSAPAPASQPVAPSGSSGAGVPSSSPPVALPQSSDTVELDPADFAGVPIDHPFWPMSPGSTWTYRETDAEGAEQQVVVTVLPETRQILGITATVVHDVVSADGETVEDTIDWYAQDASGNLWYLGEDTKEYEGGEVVSTEGSWEAGLDGAQAGIILPADPQPGMTYRQEYYAGQAEDAAEILSLDAHAEVPFGTVDGCLETRDFTPLDPDVVEQKRYARGVGPVEVVQVSGGTSHEVLLTYEPGA